LNELIIKLTEINPRDFFGQQDSNLEHIKTYFPKVKIIARGNTIKAYGNKDRLDEFKMRFDMLKEHFLIFNKLSETNIEQIMLSESKKAFEAPPNPDDVLLHGIGGKKIKAQTPNQRKLVEMMNQNDMVFAVGPAGTGKTYTGIALAVKALKEKQIRRIILTRPAVEAGENLGFLPGDLKEKLDPYMQPLYDSLSDMIPTQKLDAYIEKGVIQIAPMAFMRGRTLDDAFVILDEAQNTSHQQMKMFLTRMGKHAKFMINGDPGQVDLPKRTISGLKEAILVLKDVKGVGVIHLDDKDVIRHKVVKRIIAAYKSIENQE